MSQKRSPSTNRLLSALSEAEYRRLEPYLTSIYLPSGTVLYEASEKMDTVYFPQSALISLVNTLINGMTTEVGIIGFPGMVGLEAVLYNGYSYNRVVAQVPGEAVKISASVLRQEFDRGGELLKMLLKYAQTRLNEVSQLAVCNRHHTIEERLARWLLSVQDLTRSDELPLTQEFLGNMLGCRRSGVSITANTFQQAGIINYSRGKITILNRQALEDIACECYPIFCDRYDLRS